LALGSGLHYGIKTLIMPLMPDPVFSVFSFFYD